MLVQTKFIPQTHKYDFSMDAREFYLETVDALNANPEQDLTDKAHYLF